MGVFEELEEECLTTIIHDNMDLSRLIFHSQQIKESHLRKINRESKKARSFEGGSSKNRLDMQDKTKLKNRFSNKVP